MGFLNHFMFGFLNHYVHVIEESTAIKWAYSKKLCFKSVVAIIIAAHRYQGHFSIPFRSTAANAEFTTVAGCDGG